MVPLYLLYELSIVLSWIVFRKRAKARALASANDVSDTSEVVA
jgi:Sec-independent protein secretion pathway component TatC